MPTDPVACAADVPFGTGTATLRQDLRRTFIESPGRHPGRGPTVLDVSTREHSSHGDRARSCTYFLDYHIIATGPATETVFTMGGFYQDRLTRTADGWRINERVELGVWMDGPFPEGAPKPSWYGSNDHARPALLD